jgi:hypothetical protein
MLNRVALYLLIVFFVMFHVQVMEHFGKILISGKNGIPVMRLVYKQYKYVLLHVVFNFWHLVASWFIQHVQ